MEQYKVGEILVRDKSENNALTLLFIDTEPEQGKLGAGSELLLKRSKTGMALARLTERRSKGAEYLPNLGPWGVLAHLLGISTVAWFHVRNKRRTVLKAAEVYVKAQPDKFRRLVFYFARFLHQNHELMHSAIYDPKVETAIYEFFGSLAEKFGNYASKFPRSEKQPLSDYGKTYFRHLVRTTLLSDFKFLQERHTDQMKMGAIRYALVGGVVDPLTEGRDLNRLKFIQDIFAKDVPELNRLDKGRGMRERALQALIRIRSRAMDGLGTREAVDFYYDVCEYYGIKPREADRHAIELYWDVRKIRRPNRPELTKERAKTTEGLAIMEKYEKAVRTAAAREKELKERIERIYGKEVLEKYRPIKSDTSKPSERPTQAIYLPDGGITFRPSRKR